MVLTAQGEAYRQEIIENLNTAISMLNTSKADLANEKGVGVELLIKEIDNQIIKCVAALACVRGI